MNNKLIGGKENRRLKVNLIQMIEDSNGKFNDYSIWLKIRQILLHQSYELKTRFFSDV